jgi:predicted HicB family RNase H-like nuclease
VKSTKDYLEYKGYIGKIHYSQEDEVFFGTIFGIDDSGYI